PHQGLCHHPRQMEWQLWNRPQQSYGPTGGQQFLNRRPKQSSELSTIFVLVSGSQAMREVSYRWIPPFGVTRPPSNHDNACCLWSSNPFMRLFDYRQALPEFRALLLVQSEKRWTASSVDPPATQCQLVRQPRHLLHQHSGVRVSPK